MNKVFAIAAVTSALVLQGCATGMMGASSGTGTQNDPTRNVAIGAVLGAAAGAIIGKTTGSDHVGRDAVIGAVIGGAGGYVWTRQMQQQYEAMDKATEGTDVTVEKTKDNQLKLEIPADAGFATNQSVIQPRLQGVLNTMASTLNTNSTTVVHIYGHTDNTGSDAINYPLSQRRAEAARNYLVNRGVGMSRFTTEGKGSMAPVASNNSEAGRAENRRVEIFVGQPAK